MQQGWIGEIQDVIAALTQIGADQDDDGNFLIVGEPPISSADGGEVILSERAQYMLDGEPQDLIPLLVEYGYGVAGINIIGGWDEDEDEDEEEDDD